MNTTTDIPRNKGRVVVVAVTPEVDGGRFPIKRAVGDRVRVEATVVADGHDVLRCLLLVHAEGASQFMEVPMRAELNDTWTGEFTVEVPGRCSYSIEGWIDSFLTWRRDVKKRQDVGQDITTELLIGAAIVRNAAEHAQGHDKTDLANAANTLANTTLSIDRRLECALAPTLTQLMDRHPDRCASTTYGKELFVVVDPPIARCGAWYELFPRSCSPDPHVHGTFAMCERVLADIENLGFDVVYLPPIHPIGHNHRKGPDNSTTASAEDVGSPWAIGSEVGGHTAIHPQLGTLHDFKHFLDAARQHNLEVAIDIAFQCSPDHPYVKQHPEWFRKRPDGTIQYAENPPKKYEDIFPFNFDTDAWEPLWDELRGVVVFWIKTGVRIFRVDNPHTKPLPFWEWMIKSIKKDFPEVIFLSEAFTRPAMMYQLAKVGFSQSYNYFPWKNTKYEIESYFTELVHTDVREYFRYNLWPNTPDILPAYLQHSGRAGFVIRFVLAATLGANYGIYGPAFELCEDQPREEGTEEYSHSEKYEIKHWDTERAGNLRALIARVNAIRRANPALQRDETLTFHPTTNEHLVCYSKVADDNSNIVVTVVNVDPHTKQRGEIQLPLASFGIRDDEAFRLRDALTGIAYQWTDGLHTVELDPAVVPAHIFILEKTNGND